MSHLDKPHELVLSLHSSSEASPTTSSHILDPAFAPALAYPTPSPSSDLAVVPPAAVYAPYGDMYALSSRHDETGQPWVPPSAFEPSFPGFPPRSALSAGLTMPLSPGTSPRNAVAPALAPAPFPASSSSSSSSSQAGPLTVGNILNAFPSPSTRSGPPAAGDHTARTGTDGGVESSHVVEGPIGLAPRVKPFITKLNHLVSHPESYSDCVVWDAAGEAFIVNANKRFVGEVLPRLFGHRNVASFTRQLNVYGFRRLPAKELAIRIDIEVLDGYSAWSHPEFTRGDKSRQHLLSPRPSRARQLKKAEKQERAEEERLAAAFARRGSGGAESSSTSTSPAESGPSVSASPVYSAYAPLPGPIPVSGGGAGPPLPLPTSFDPVAAPPSHFSGTPFSSSSSSASASTSSMFSLAPPGPVTPPTNTLGLLWGTQPYSIAPTSCKDLEYGPG